MSLKPQVAMSDDFLKAFAAVPREQQQAVLGFVARFRQNPMAAGINYERIRDAGDPHMRSVRISDSLRGILLQPETGNVYCLLWVDRHDDAYRWARRHRVAVHPDIGSLQIYAVEPVQAAAGHALPATPPPATPAGLFATLKDRQIRRLGVPNEQLAAVRALSTAEALEALEAQLPDEAFEALYLYAAGEPYDSLVTERTPAVAVDPDDFAAALERDSTRRHFVVLTEDSDLEALLAAPLERWRVFLHPDQRRLVERDWNGPVKVTGGAGTGKTVVAMHRAAWLARRYAGLPGQPVLFTTFTRTLAEDIRRHLALLCTPAELARIRVVNLDQWVLGVLRHFGYRHELLYDEDRRRQFWQKAMDVLPDSLELSPAFVRAEYERVVLAQGCEQVEDYLQARRIGRGGVLARAQRKALWPVFAEYRALLQTEGLREPEAALRDALCLLRDPGAALGIRAMVIDEAQDIGTLAFELIRAAVPAADNDLFLVGDAHQRIYRRQVVLGQAGIEVRGRSRRLRVNYRTTDEIRRWACRQLEGVSVDDLDGDLDSLRGYRSLSHGDEPEVCESVSLQDDLARIRTLRAQLAADGIDDRQVCIAVRSNEDLASLADLLGRAGIAYLKLDRNTADDPAVAGLRLATLHRIKGLEFGVVIIAAYRGPAAYAAHYTQDDDAQTREEAARLERCLLHVAATRAKRHLLVLQRPQSGS